MATPRALRGPAVPRRAVLVAAAALAVAVAVAAALATGVLGRGSSTSSASRWAIGQDVPTSFGAVAIDSLGRSPTRPSEMVAFVALTNLAHRPVAYSPAQFRLLGGPRRRPLAGLRMTFRAGTLQPAASFSGQLRFPAPRDGSSASSSSATRAAARRS